MKTTTFTRSSIAIVLLLLGASTARAQQAFEFKHVKPRMGTTELVPLPTIGIAPVDAAPLNTDVAAQLSEAVQNELDTTQESRFEVLMTHSIGSKVKWAFVVRNSPRAMHDAFTQQFTGQLIRCLHSLEDGVDLATLNVLLVGSSLDDQQQRDQANAAGDQMLANWKADRCITRRNSLPFFERNLTRLTASTHGMLTDAFDPLMFHGQALLDLIHALSPLYFYDDGFWATEMKPRLQALFDAAVRTGLLTTAETSRIADREQRTFWDWVILVVSTKLSIVHSFLENTAAGCVKTVPELSSPFQLSRCVSGGKLLLVTLRYGGQDYTTVQRVQP